MEQPDILKEWSNSKQRPSPYYRLAESCLIEYEFRGPRRGHPSNYALVKFSCEPADRLEFHSVAEWPNLDHGPDIYGHEQAIRTAIVDELFCRSYTSFKSGCSFTLLEIAYDDVSSSPAAFYWATAAAVAELVKTKEWKIQPVSR